MTISVRLSGPLARDVGAPRLVRTLGADATVATLIEQLSEQYPDLAGRLSLCVAAVDGRIVPKSEPLIEGSEVALLVPVAGGSPTPAGLT